MFGATGSFPPLGEAQRAVGDAGPYKGRPADPEELSADMLPAAIVEHKRRQVLRHVQIHI